MIEYKSNSFLCNTANHIYLNNIHFEIIKLLLEVYDSIIYKHQVTLQSFLKFNYTTHVFKHNIG